MRRARHGDRGHGSVAVSAAPYSIDKPYSYLVPEHLADAAVPGVRVVVPLAGGNKGERGPDPGPVPGAQVAGGKGHPAGVLDPEPVLDKAGIDLALWMRGRYFCTVFEAVKTILPTGLWYGLREVWSLHMGSGGACPPPRASPAHGRHWNFAGAAGRPGEIQRLRWDTLGDGRKTLKALKKAEILT